MLNDRNAYFRKILTQINVFVRIRASCKRNRRSNKCQFVIVVVRKVTLLVNLANISDINVERIVTVLWNSKLSLIAKSTLYLISLCNVTIVFRNKIPFVCSKIMQLPYCLIDFYWRILDYFQRH